MKVTVCFDKTKVIVPCGDGELTVSELIKRAVNRYCKAASYIDNLSDIDVHCLQTEEQAILDIDDLVADVCDDKDKLIAVYDDRNKKTARLVLDNPADVDNNNIRNAQTPYTTTPSIQHDEDITPYITSTLSDNDSGVAADSYGISSNPTSTHTSFNSSSRPPRGIRNKFPQNKNASFRSSASSNSPTSSPETSRKMMKGPAFSRGLNRKSLSTNHPMLYSWIDQHDKFNSPRYFQDNSHEEEEDERITPHSSENEVIQLDRRASKTIDVQPYTTTDGKEIGLVVHNVQEGSYVDRVGELQTADRITEINGKNITSLPNAQAMDMYNSALEDDVIKLKRARSHSFLIDNLELQASATTTTDVVGTDVPDRVIKASKEAPRPVPKLVESTPKESAIEAPSSSETDSPLDSNRHVFAIDLIKESEGLGFSVTSKDVLTSKKRTFFIKNVLNKGAAIKDGRLKAGDQLLAINKTEVEEKSQADVVKILRSSKGKVSLRLSRLKSEMSEEEIASLQNQSSASSCSSQEVTPRINEPTSPTSLSPPEDILTLTMLLTSAGADSLGISVKGKRAGDSNEDNGIFVKSVLKGGAAAKDGRLLPNDHLMCINDTSLIGLSNNDAMKVLKVSLEKSKEKGTIRIIIGRLSRVISRQISSGTSSPAVPSSPVRGDVAATSFGRSSPVVTRKAFKRPESPSLDRGRKTPERFSPRLEMRRKISTEKPVENKEGDKEFDDRYLQRGLTPAHYAIGRNKSYFRAVNPQTATAVEVDITPSRGSPDSRRTVSVSSMEVPTVQRSVPVFFPDQEESGEGRNSMRANKQMPLPSYEEALKRQSSNSSTHSSTRTDSRKNSFKVLPDKYFAISKDSKPAAEKTLSLESNLPEKYILPKGEELHKQISMRKSLSLDSIKGPLSPNSESGTGIIRTNTMASQSSLDSIFLGSYQFSRDGLGRLSISEKKGRGHIDATQSDFYNKLKKFKSMEELRPSLSNENIFLDDSSFLKRTESVDTIISKIDAEELKYSFKRNDQLSASTPWGHQPSPMLNGNGVQRRKANDNMESPVPRRLKHPKNRRPYSCILDDARNRNSMLNESFKTALDNLQTSPVLSITSSNADEKKKKGGLLKGITGLLKKNKKTRDGKTSSSPEQIESPPRKESREDSNEVVRRSKSNGNARPASMGDALHKNHHSNKFFQADQLQKELVQAKIDEMKKGKNGVKKRKSDNEIHKIGRASPSKEERGYKSGYNTWNVHDANNMREKSKQFFKNDGAGGDGGGQDSVRSSGRSIQLQRQSSLPPRTKKDDFHRVLPRAPSGPMYKSPEQKHRTTSKTSNNSKGSASAPNTKPNTPVKPNALKITNSHQPPANNRLKTPDEGEVRYSSISDLTRSGGSIKISHKAEI